MQKFGAVIRFLVRVFFVMSVLLLFFSAGFAARSYLDGTNTSIPFLPSSSSDTPILRQARELLIRNGLKDLPAPPALEYGMIRGMLQSYDEAHTVFVEPAQHTLEIDTLEGKFGGIGVRLERDSQGLLRIYPLPDSPSLKAGVLDGDQLFQAGDLVIIKDTPFDQIAFAVCGPVGEKVDIIIGHAPDFAPVKLSIQRAEIALPSVTYNLVPEEPRVGIIHVSVIAATTPDEIKKAILDLTSKQAAYFILDLRDNGGGLVDAGVDTVRMFLKEGVVTEQQFKGAPVESFKVEKVGEFIAIPLVVLVNQNTASAAEIVSGALQAQHRAKLVGTDTYGKDTIQRIFDLKDGSSLHVTSAKWWVPGLTVPLKPDILQADDPNNANAVVMTAVKALLQP